MPKLHSSKIGVRFHCIKSIEKLHFLNLFLRLNRLIVFYVTDKLELNYVRKSYKEKVNENIKAENIKGMAERKYKGDSPLTNKPLSAISIY